VWKRTYQGRELHFYLAGINNQNFLMRDKETGTWWQQITGLAVDGPMKGAALDLVPSDELTFGEWKSEVAGGKVFAPVEKYKKEYDSNWEPEVAKLPVVISFPGTELKSRDVVVGLEMEGASRAYPWDTLVKQSPVMDRVHGKPLLVAVGPDGKSFRVFVSRIDGKDTEFFQKNESESDATSEAAAEKKSDAADNPAVSTDAKVTSSTAPVSNSPSISSSPAASASSPNQTAALSAPKPWVLLDSATGSEWNFQGCAISGSSQGKCLERVYALKDYWFDWRNYHADTTIYKR
jgi:hypothetical protein